MRFMLLPLLVIAIFALVTAALVGVALKIVGFLALAGIALIAVGWLATKLGGFLGRDDDVKRLR